MWDEPSTIVQAFEVPRTLRIAPPPTAIDESLVGRQIMYLWDIGWFLCMIMEIKKFTKRAPYNVRVQYEPRCKKDEVKYFHHLELDFRLTTEKEAKEAESNAWVLLERV